MPFDRRQVATLGLSSPAQRLCIATLGILCVVAQSGIIGDVTAITFSGTTVGIVECTTHVGRVESGTVQGETNDGVTVAIVVRNTTKGIV